MDNTKSIAINLSHVIKTATSTSVPNLVQIRSRELL